MRRSRLLAGLLPTLLLLLPVATMAQDTLPERLNGIFQFIDKNETINNQLEFVVDADPKVWHENPGLVATRQPLAL